MKEMGVDEFTQHNCYFREEAASAKRVVEAYQHREMVRKTEVKQPLLFGLKRTAKTFPDATPWLWVGGIAFVLWFLWAVTQSSKTRIPPSDCDVSTTCTESK